MTHSDRDASERTRWRMEVETDGALCHELSDDCPCGPRSEPVGAADPSAHHMMSVTRQWCLACGAEAVDGILPQMPCPGITGVVEKNDDMPCANAEAIITNIRDEIRELRREGSVKTGGTYADLADLLETLLESQAAPAGLPLHESADRDADNVPSDRVRAYAEALRNPDAFVDRLTVTDVYPDGRDSRELLVDWQARAVMAVAGREQAELRAEIERLTNLAESNRRSREHWRDEANLQLDEARETKDALLQKCDQVARVEALADLWDALPCVCGYRIPNDNDDNSQCRSCGALDLRDALRGPEPTDAP